MDIQKVFQSISRKMMIDFELSADMEHHGNRGNYREDTLAKFLMEGKIPKQYNIGSGEIISRYSESSKQIDLIIYDSLKSIQFVSSESIQIYPIESIYGVIEVKSKLSKTKLLESLENIKSIKSMSGHTQINKKMGQTKIHYHTNPPFGMIFAYGLSGNSLDSLRNNLSEWMKKNPPKVWPNMICVLNEGIIKFGDSQNFTRELLYSSEINESAYISSIPYKENSLFEFTTRLINLCQSREIEVFDINAYKTIGYISNGLRVMPISGWKTNITRFTDDFIKNIYESGIKKISYKRYIELSTGADISSVEAHFPEKEVFLYNPNNLSGLLELRQKPENADKEMLEILQNTPNIVNAYEITIEGQCYLIPWPYITNDNTIMDQKPLKPCTSE